VFIGLVMFEGAAGVKGLHVPYRGIAPVFQDLRGGTLDFTSRRHLPDGLKILAAVGAARHPSYPNVPTLVKSASRAASGTLRSASGTCNLPKPSPIVSSRKSPPH
jgi:tripartite-type tricarboxylate transporter receptor subunit TctC